VIASPSPDPPRARQLTSRRLDARHRPADRLDRDRHMERIGVDQRIRVAHDGDVALPEQEIAAAQVGEVARKCNAERGLLHVAVARARYPAGRERDLEQPRAIEPERGLAAPQIGHVQKRFGDGDRVGREGVERRQMPGRNIAAGTGDRERLLQARDREPAAER